MTDLGKYIDIIKSGIQPSLYPEESFYYYDLPSYDEGGKPSIVTGKSIASNKFTFKDEVILISKLNPRKKRVWDVKNDKKYRSVGSTEFVVIKPKDVVKRYLYYFLQSTGVYKQLKSVAIGSTNSHVRFQPAFLNGIRVDFPLEPVQTKIAKILTTLDNVIEKTEAAIAKYEAIKQGMMHDLFTRGIGKDGQLRPSYEDAPELYKESQLGWIPKEWDVDHLGNCGTFSKGSNIPKYQLAPSGEGCVLYGQLYTKYHNTIEKTESRVPAEFVKGMSPLKHGSILFAGSGETHEEIGKCAVFLMDDKVFAGGDIVILDLDDEFYKPYFGYFLNFESIQRQKARLGQGSSVIHIYPKHLSLILIAIPKKEEQKLIFKKINGIDSQLKREQKTLSKQTQLKQGLMQDLLTGKVSVKADPINL